ncbi:MAG: nucleoside deaminase [Mariprofundaceae bacterium]|nr:nucleoside deaminase [Mariprofundaceae bacterium]
MPNSQVFPDIQISLPQWLQAFPFRHDRIYPHLQERMRLVIELSRLNVKHQTGGPFAAAVFDANTHQLIAPGVNLVVPSHASLAHAEMVAITIAQQHRQHFYLGTNAQQSFELVSSTEPCAMCMAALAWSGIQQLICGARDADARAIGFDEGHKVQPWQDSLRQQGIGVKCDICRDEAVAVLQYYARKNGLIYNGRSEPFQGSNC